MSETYWEYDSTHRGIEIQRWMPGPIAYGAWIDGDWIVRVSKSALKDLIDDWLGPEEPETYWEYDSTHRGIEIQRWMPGPIAYGAWIDGDWVVRVSKTELQGLIDAYLDVPVVTSISISAPASAEAGVPFVVSGFVLDQYNVGMGGVTVYLYDNGSLFDTTTTFSSGYYLFPFSISQAGVHELAARADSVEDYRDITITEAAPEPPVITRVTIDAPTSADAGAAFTVSGFVLDQYNRGIGGSTVYLGDNGSLFATVTTNSNGYYFKNTSISIAGVHELIAVAESGIFATKNITITAPPVADMPTSLTISAPSSVEPNEAFFISGILYEKDSGIPIPNQPINHSYNGRSLGSSTTGVDGNYLKEVSIPESGTWTLKSEFLGADIYQTSRALVDAVVGVPPILTALLIAGPIVTGLALVIYGSR